jgi:GNAT superfamily N-acetyltransferase
MYGAVAQVWVNQHTHLHLIRHFAHDAVLQETLYQLGFGAILAERLRDFSAVDGRDDVVIHEEQDIGRLTNIQTEHNLYYPNAPIFIQKPSGIEEVVAELQEHVQNGDIFLVYEEDHEPCAYMIVGESARDAEGFLLEQTNTAQVKSAYVRPEIRSKGIGSALLERAIQWSKHQGYCRLLVEHETANMSGGNFWGKYFAPYLYSSMRYIDNAL